MKRVRGPSGPGPVLVRVPHSHLFPGLTLAVHLDEDRSAPLLLQFADGSTAAAELVQSSAGRYALAVSSYQTARGTHIGDRLWRLDPSQLLDSGQDTLKLGPRLV